MPPFRYYSLCLLFVIAGWASAQDFPAETVVCRDGAYTLNAPAGISGPSFQWERSFDGGGSWNEINGATGASHLITQPTSGISYRLRHAGEPGCLADPNCASVTNATRLVIRIPEFFQSAVICAGDSVGVGDEWLTTAGNHTVRVENGDCDSLVHTFVVVNPAYDQLFVATLCPGEEFEGVSVNQDTTFTRRLQTATGCDSTVTYELDLSFPADLTISGPDEICAGESATLSVAGQFTGLNWNTGGNGRQITVNEAGTYALVLTNTGGCTLELEHSVAVVELDARLNTLDPPCPGAAGGRITVDATGDNDLLYSFDGGANFVIDSFRHELNAGEYDIVVESPGGCRWTEGVTLSEGPELNLFSPEPMTRVIERGDTVDIEVSADFAVERWEWNTSFGLSCTDCPDPAARPLTDTRYVLTAYGAGGCSVEMAFDFTVRDNRRFYAPNAFQPDRDGQNDHFQLYPGPRTTAVEGFTVFDRWGGTLYRQAESLPPNDDRLRWDGDSNGQELPAGTYGYAARLWFSDGSQRTVSGTVNLIR